MQILAYKVCLGNTEHRKKTTTKKTACFLGKKFQNVVAENFYPESYQLAFFVNL